VSLLGSITKSRMCALESGRAVYWYKIREAISNTSATLGGAAVAGKWEFDHYRDVLRSWLVDRKEVFLIWNQKSDRCG
jgi:hypothetical protein